MSHSIIYKGQGYADNIQIAATTCLTLIVSLSFHIINLSVSYVAKTNYIFRFYLPFCESYYHQNNHKMLTINYKQNTKE